MDRVIVRHLGRAGAIAAIALALGACDHPWIEKKRIALGGWTQERMLADGWLKAPHRHGPAVHCHETLADPDCHPVQAKRRATPPIRETAAKAGPAKADPGAAKDK